MSKNGVNLQYKADGKYSTTWFHLYEDNPDFHAYVDRVMRPGKNFWGIPLEEVLCKRTIQLVGQYYATRPRNEESSNSPFSPNKNNDICDCEDKSC